MNCFFIFAILTRQIIHKVLLKENVRQIVVFAPNKLFFGANILQIPFFQHLRSGYPYARITIWSPEKASEMMLNLNLADELLIYHGWGDYFRIFRRPPHPSLDYQEGPSRSIRNLPRFCLNRSV